MFANKIRVAEKVLLYVTCLAVLVAAIVFIVLALSRPSHAAELVLGPSPAARPGHATVTVALPVPTARPVKVRPPVVRVMAAVATPAPLPPKPPPPPLPPGSVRARIAAAWPGDDAWADRVTGCETGRTWDPRAVNPNGHYGLWQFDMGTWAEVGGAGNPIDASVEEQTSRAWALFSKPDGGPGRWECA